MDERGIFFIIKGGEALADAVARACERAFPGAKTFVTQAGGQPPAWRVLARIPEAPGEGDQWQDVASLISDAMASVDAHAGNPLLDSAREAFEALFEDVRAIVAATPGSSALAGLAGEEPVDIGEAAASRFAWRLLEE